MNNTYVFIIWNRALYWKDKIINDINESFIIKKQFYINWSKNDFKKNLKALYGAKLTNPEDKIKFIGKNKFFVVIVEDENPEFKKRELQHKQEMVNSRIYDKKWLYRKWTAGNFRIHCSIDESETKHDLVVLLGPNYKEVIENIDDNVTLCIDTKTVTGFDSINDLLKSLELFGNNNTSVDSNVITIDTNNKQNIIDFIGPTYMNGRCFIVIDDITYDVVINENNALEEIINNESLINKVKNEIKYVFLRLINK